jgi:hypothetical protein
LLRLGVFLLISVWNRARQPECRRPFSAFKALSCLISENHAWFLFIMPYCQYKAHSWSLAFFVVSYGLTSPLMHVAIFSGCPCYVWAHIRDNCHTCLSHSLRFFFPCYSTQHVFCVNALRAELQSTFFIFFAGRLFDIIQWSLWSLRQWKRWC